MKYDHCKQQNDPEAAAVADNTFTFQTQLGLPGNARLKCSTEVQNLARAVSLQLEDQFYHIPYTE